MAAQSVAQNTKALDFQEFLMENNIGVFSSETLDDDYNTVIFRSKIETHGQLLPMAISIDMSIVPVSRTQSVTGVEKARRPAMKEYLNSLNERFKIFRYYLRDDGTLMLDVCLPFVDETFDSKMIQLMLSVIVQHLEAVYQDIMAEVWHKI